MNAALLAWTPFLQPLPLEAYWMWLILPIAAAIAVVYKALKLRNIEQLPVEAAKLTVVIIASMIIAAIALYVLVEAV